MADRSASSVPDDPAGEAHELGDEVRKAADLDLLAAADVDRLGAVVALRREPESLDAVVDVQELSRGTAIAPDNDLPFAALLAPRPSCGSEPG